MRGRSAGCGGSQSTLNPHSHQSADIANLFWVMMAVAFGAAFGTEGAEPPRLAAARDDTP